MTVYEKFKKLTADPADIGLERGDEKSDYFCTPKAAKVLGWAGVDGIHYCHIKGFGDMVFAVSPSNAPGDYVHPLAESFEDFMRLILACGNAGTLEQIHGWTQEQFDAFLREDQPMAPMAELRRTIGEELGLVPMEHPFSYVKKQQVSFDYSRIPFSCDASQWVPTEPAAPSWAVYFDGGFGGYSRRGLPGRELPIGKQFIWGGNIWHIPAVYSCGSGLVVDLLREVDPDRIQAFLEKWNLEGGAEPQYTDEERETISTEHPLSMSVRPRVVVNGKALQGYHGWGNSWMPGVPIPPENDREAKQILEHYGLDPSRGWAFQRHALRWATKTRPTIRTLTLTLEQDPVTTLGTHFQVSAPGQRISFPLPRTGAVHTLTVQEYEAGELSHEYFRNDGFIYPRHYMGMTYTVTPDLPDGAFSLRDCARGDSAQRNPDAPQSSAILGMASVGLIANAKGPVLFSEGNATGKLRAVSSSLHFAPVETVEWRMVFYEKTLEDITVDLM